MLEYVLFSEHIRKLFTIWLQDNQIEFQLAGVGEELLVLISEDIDELTEEKIETQYDFLLDESAKLADEEDSDNAIHIVGIQFTNAKGGIGQVKIPPKLANQIQSCMTAAELQAFVQLIADEVMNPEEKPLCQTVNGAS